MSKDENVWLIMICRSPLPQWLMPLYIKSGFQIIEEDDLKLTESEVSQYLETLHIQLDEEQFAYLCKKSDGNAYIIRHAVRLVAQGKKVNEELREEISKVFADYLANDVIIQWDSDLVDFLTQVSVVEEFNIPLAEIITGNNHVYVLLDKALSEGNFISREGDIYRMRPVLLQALQKRAERIYGSERIRGYAYNAGLYYETHERIIQALAMYERCGNDDRIRELLIRNARRNPGNGHYYELRKYYLSMKEEDIEGSVILMAGMSMLYSLLMQKKESEYWYDKLKAFAQVAKGGEKREALSRIAYLDIALPHRGSMNILKILKTIPSLLFDNGIGLPEFSVTSNLPSTMNGGKDFCHWSLKDKELAGSIGKLVERILGRYGKGLVNTALGESYYEKGEDTYEVLTLLSRAQMQTEEGGMLEIAFTSVGLQVRLNLLHGNEGTASDLLFSFEKKVKEQDAKQLIPNINAMKCRIALYTGDNETVNRWMDDAPNEDKEFFILERYQYLTKVRCYIWQGEYMKAYGLLEKLKYYAEKCDRTYIRMETGILTAITQYRLGVHGWRDTLISTLKEVCTFRFLRLVSEEGAGIQELLGKVKKDCFACEDIDDKWFQTLLLETEKMAMQYPIYLKGQIAEIPDFSDNALAVLRLQANGLAVGEIAKRLSMKVETVRYHTKQNYKKLGVSGKTDAVLAARNLGIL